MIGGMADVKEKAGKATPTDPAHAISILMMLLKVGTLRVLVFIVVTVSVPIGFNLFSIDRLPSLLPWQLASESGETSWMRSAFISDCTTDTAQAAQ